MTACQPPEDAGVVTPEQPARPQPQRENPHMKQLVIAAAATAFSLGAFAASHAEKGAMAAKPAASAAATKPAAAPAAKPAASAAAKKTKKAASAPA